MEQEQYEENKEVKNKVIHIFHIGVHKTLFYKYKAEKMLIIVALLTQAVWLKAFKGGLTTRVPHSRRPSHDSRGSI